jgi:hypothetical protein
MSGGGASKVFIPYCIIYSNFNCSSMIGAYALATTILAHIMLCKILRTNHEGYKFLVYGDFTSIKAA